MPTYGPEATWISQVFDSIGCRPDKVMAAMITNSDATVHLVRGS